jgi:hypothetical protein
MTPQSVPILLPPLSCTIRSHLEFMPLNTICCNRLTRALLPRPTRPGPRQTGRPGNLLQMLPLRQPCTLQNVIRDNGALLILSIIRVLYVVDTKVVEARNADGVEKEDTASFAQVGDFDGVETKADGFAGAEHAAEDADIVG